MVRNFTFREQLSTMAKERLESSKIGTMIRMVSEKGAISFAAGEPSEELFPIAELKEAFAGVFDDPSLLCYYKDDYGYVPLREWIAERMKEDGIAPQWVKDQNVLLTNGGGEGIELVAEALIDPGSVVLVESPTFTESLLTFKKQGAHCMGVPSDEHGIIPEALSILLKSRRVRFLYTIPNYQNPSGRTSPLERRIEILDLAKKHDIPIFEDDPYHYFSYENFPPASYLFLAGEDMRVIHCSSFSKTLAPGLRSGWIVVPPALRAEMNALRVSAGLGRPAILQRGLYLLLKEMDFPLRIKTLRETYRERRDGMVTALRKHLAGTGVVTNIPEGGFFIWGRADHIKDMTSFAKYAVEEKGVGIIPGSAFYSQQEMDSSTFRLSFAKVSPQLAEEGARRLASAFREYREFSF